MERKRYTKIMSLIILVIAIVGVSIGFAAFSTTLTISNSGAKGTKADNDANFKNKLTITNVSCDGNEGSYNAGTISANSFIWTGATVNLSSPNESITCTATVKNDSVYTAYLNSIELDSNIICDTTDSQNATAACNGLQLKVNGNVSGKAEATATTTAHTDATNVTGDYISAGQTGKFSFTVTYTHNVALDDNYTATLPVMTFNYSTVD